MKCSILCGVLSSILFGALSMPSSHAQRAGMFEAGVSLQGFVGDTVDGDIYGRTGDLELDSIFSGGMNFGYNFNNYLNLNTDIVYSSADLSFKGSGLDLSDDAHFFAWTVNLDYNILPTPLTPFVTAGFGMLSLNNEYYDYWWYYAPPRQEIPLDEVNFLWNVGAGLRWDIQDYLYLKLAYRLNGVELDLGEEQMLLHSVILTVGVRFGGN